MVIAPMARLRREVYFFGMSKPDIRENHEAKPDMQRYNELWKNIITTAAGIITLLALILASKAFGGEAEKIVAAPSVPSASVAHR